MVKYNEMKLFKRPVSMLKEHRLDLRMTQKQVADAVGLSLRQYQRYERGDLDLAIAPFQLGVALCEVLKIDFFDVVDHIEDIQEFAEIDGDKGNLPGSLLEES